MLLLLADKRHLAFLGVLAYIGLLDELLVLDSAHFALRIEHMSWHLAMAGDTFNLRMGCIFLLERLLIVEISTFPRTYDAKLFGCIRLPHTNVHFIGAREDVPIVQRPSNTDHMLHTFGMIDITRMALMGMIYAHSLVVAGGDKLLACGGIVNVCHSRDVVEVNLQWRLQLACVKGVKTKKEI